MPFLSFDSDPYFAIVDGRPEWIWDAYTTTDQYPYSQVASTSRRGDRRPAASTGTVNYMRNSVKVVMDAYDGTMTYYATTSSDPIIQAWSNAFPGAVHRRSTGAAGASRRTSATRRTSSRCRRRSSPTTT